MSEDEYGCEFTPKMTIDALDPEYILIDGEECEFVFPDCGDMV